MVQFQKQFVFCLCNTQIWLVFKENLIHWYKKAAVPEEEIIRGACTESEYTSLTLKLIDEQRAF